MSTASLHGYGLSSDVQRRRAELHKKGQTQHRTGTGQKPRQTGKVIEVVLSPEEYRKHVVYLVEQDFRPKFLAPL